MLLAADFIFRHHHDSRPPLRRGEYIDKRGFIRTSYGLTTSDPVFEKAMADLRGSVLSAHSENAALAFLHRTEERREKEARSN